IEQGDEGEFQVGSLVETLRLSIISGRHGNPVPYSFRIYQYIMIPESDHPETLGFKPARPGFVISCRIGMLATIEFDDQPAFKANEVGEVSAQRNLPAELEGLQLAVTKNFP